MNISLEKIYGPPGTGKTTTLIERMEKSGIPFERIAFVSFTRATIAEIQKRLNLNEVQGEYFRTIHSMNFRLLKVNKTQMAQNHLHTFNARFSPEFIRRESRRPVDDTTVIHTATDTIDDGFYKQMMWERLQMLPRDYVPPHYSKNATLYLSFKNRYHTWLTDNDYIDFTGLLERGIERRVLPPVDLLCVDEWQDLNPLQVYQVSQWAKHIPYSIHAGDDDQTIHEWAGARHEDFLEFPTFSVSDPKTTILNRTYRLPKNVLDMSVSFIERNERRMKKEGIETANKTTGIIEYTHIDKAASVLRESLKQGKSCRVLVVANSLITKVSEQLTERGIPVSDILADHVRAISILKHTKDTISTEDLDFMASNAVFPARVYFIHGGKKKAKAIAQETAKMGQTTLRIDQLRDILNPYFYLAIENGDPTGLKKKGLAEALEVYKNFGRTFSPVQITTIHQSKGSEAETVVVCLDVPKKVMQEERNPHKREQLRRIWYVAITRTKQNLLFLQPSFRGYYPSLFTDYVKVYVKQT